MIHYYCYCKVIILKTWQSVALCIYLKSGNHSSFCRFSDSFLCFSVTKSRQRTPMKTVIMACNMTSASTVFITSDIILFILTWQDKHMWSKVKLLNLSLRNCWLLFDKNLSWVLIYVFKLLFFEKSKPGHFCCIHIFHKNIKYENCVVTKLLIIFHYTILQILIILSR
jgi:hypothetical protein